MPHSPKSLYRSFIRKLQQAINLAAPPHSSPLPLFLPPHCSLLLFQSLVTLAHAIFYLFLTTTLNLHRPNPKLCSHPDSFPTQEKQQFKSVGKPVMSIWTETDAAWGLPHDYFLLSSRSFRSPFSNILKHAPNCKPMQVPFSFSIAFFCNICVDGSHIFQTEQILLLCFLFLASLLPTHQHPFSCSEKFRLRPFFPFTCLDFLIFTAAWGLQLVISPPFS